MIHHCFACGDRFDGERWQRYCWPCWRERRDRNVEADGYDRGFAAGLAAAHRRSPSFDRELIALAVELCHPDRHPPERFEKANRVTAALLELRKGLAV